MKVLFVVPYVPSLVRVRPFNLIRGLSARGHEVTVATIWTNDRERAELEALARHCRAVIDVRLPAWRSLANCGRALATSDPLQSRYSWSPALMDCLNAARTGCDVVHIEHLRGAQSGSTQAVSPVPCPPSGTASTASATCSSRPWPIVPIASAA